MFDHLFQYRISPRPITAEKRGFCTCVTDGRTDQRTDGQTLLQRCEDASKNDHDTYDDDEVYDQDDNIQGNDNHDNGNNYDENSDDKYNKGNFNDNYGNDYDDDEYDDDVENDEYDDDKALLS